VCAIFPFSQHELMQSFSIHLFAKLPVEPILTLADYRDAIIKRIIVVALQVHHAMKYIFLRQTDFILASFRLHQAITNTSRLLHEPLHHAHDQGCLILLLGMSLRCPDRLTQCPRADPSERAREGQADSDGRVLAP